MSIKSFIGLMVDYPIFAIIVGVIFCVILFYMFIKGKGTYIYTDSLNWYLAKRSQDDRSIFKVNGKEVKLKCFGTPPKPYLLLDKNSIEKINDETHKRQITENFLDTSDWIPIRLHPLCYNKEITIEVEKNKC